MKKIILLVLPILVGLNLINLNAQSKEKDIPLNLGGYLGLNYNMHNGDFYYPSILNATPNSVVPIGFYGTESSLGLNGGLIINVSFDNMFVFSGRLGVHGAGADFNVTGIDIGRGTTPDTTTYTDSFESSLMYGEIDLFMQFHNVIPVDNLYLLAGLELGIPLTASYDRAESSVMTGSSITTESSATTSSDIVDTPLRLALALGAGYMMEIDDNVFLTPEVSFRLPFSNVSDFNGGTNNDWNFAQLRAGVSLTFGFGDDEVEPDPESTINVGLKDIRAITKMAWLIM